MVRHIVCGLGLLLSVCFTTIGSAAEPIAYTEPVLAEDDRTEEQENQTRKVGYLKIEGDITDLQLRYYKRALEDAKAAGVTTVVTEIDSPGGLLFTAESMLDLTVASDGPEMVAYVEDGAYSAAAMIAYGHEKVFLGENAIIGNIGVIFQGPDGTMQYAPEKIETVVRALLRKAGQRRGWNEALLAKMTARNQTLFQARFPDGRKEYVLEENMGLFLADNPEIDEEDSDQWIVVRGEDSLLTLPAKDAMEAGMATAIVTSITDVYEYLDVNPNTVIDLSPTENEMLARQFSGMAPILLALALMLVFLEMKTPGLGIAASAAAVCFVGYFFLQYYQDLVAHVEIVIFALGIALVIAEIFTAVGGGLIGILGGLCILSGLLLTSLPNDLTWSFSSERFGNVFADAMLNILIVSFGLAFGAIMFFTLAPKLPFLNRVAVATTLNESVVKQADQDLVQQQAELGDIVTYSDLMPTGTIMINDEIRSAHALHGKHIPAGTKVTIVDTQFGDFVVDIYKTEDVS